MSYFMNIMYKHIFLNFGVISFINKEIVSFIQLHTYKFDLVYINCVSCFVQVRTGSSGNFFHFCGYTYLANIQVSVFRTICPLVSYFCSKYRLGVHVRSVLLRQF